MRRPSDFKITNATRLIKAVLAAGLKPARVVYHANDSTIAVEAFVGNANDLGEKQPTITINEWDEVK
jgi:hypothetical protein